MKTKIIYLIFTLTLITISLLYSQPIISTTNQFQSSIICHQSDYLNNLTNYPNALLHCFTYTILGTENQPELSENFIYDDKSNTYYFKEGFSYHIIFFNTTYDLGITNISYNEYTKANNWIENNLELFYEINLTYDLNGNLIQDNNNYYEYDDFNHLVRVRLTNSTGNITEEYLYDNEGQRLLKIEVKNQTNQTTYYIGDSFVHIVNSSGNYNQTFYYANGILIAEKDISGNNKFYHPDHLGSTSLITNQSGNQHI